MHRANESGTNYGPDMNVNRCFAATNNDLPYPNKAVDIKELLSGIDTKLFKSSSTFIERQVRQPIESVLNLKTAPKKIPLASAQAEWLNIYSVYRANQEINEACNKLWSVVELTNVTSKSVWKVSYKPVGADFSRSFSYGTLVPTLYYAVLSAILGILSCYGFLPIIFGGRAYVLVRTEKGWGVFDRRNFLSEKLGVRVRSWHEQVLQAYGALQNGGSEVPTLPLASIRQLKQLRNAMHYEILGDLKMWRAFRAEKHYDSHLRDSFDVIEKAIDSLACIKQVTTGCDQRFMNLRKSATKTSWFPVALSGLK